jgi:hypothetical protein
MQNILYFYHNINKNIKLTPSFYIKKRKNRNLIKGSKFKKFVVGDIIEFVFFFRIYL